MDSSRRGEPRSTLLLVTQVYVPDPASVGQHMASVAEELVRRGFRVVVLTSARGYDDPSRRYPSRERRNGVEIRRLRASSFGKRSIPIRVVAAALFLGQALLHALLTRRLGGIVVSTSPPMASTLGLLVSCVRRTPLVYWLMDLNPEQAIEMGRVRESSWSVRVFRFVNRLTVGRAARVVALDRYMADRVATTRPLGDRLLIIPPWPHGPVAEEPTATGRRFREEHGIGDRFVFMYSGNHSPAHPLTTFLAAARRLEDRDDVRFLFVGGGQGKAEIDDAISAGARNLLSLPYQPFEDLAESLAAADVHLVSFGERMVGIVHPCKAYGAMATGRPLLLTGPERCPITDVIARHDVGWRVEHGDDELLADLMRRIAGMPDSSLRSSGRRAVQAIRAELSEDRLRGALCDAIATTATRG